MGCRLQTASRHRKARFPFFFYLQPAVYSLQPVMSFTDPVLSRLRWHCRRGMRELDVVLARYLEHDYPAATQAERQAFEALLKLQDPELFSYLVGRIAPPADPDLAHVLERIARYRG